MTSRLPVSSPVIKATAREARRLAFAWEANKGMLPAKQDTRWEETNAPAEPEEKKSKPRLQLDESIFREPRSGKKYNPVKGLVDPDEEEDAKPVNPNAGALQRFAENVQELLGNNPLKKYLTEKRDIGEGLDTKEWARLRNLETAPMDKDLFRKVCRLVVAEDLIPTGMKLNPEETKALSILPKKAGKIGDDWAIPSPDNCVKLLNVFSKIESPQEKKADPYAKLDAMPEKSSKGKPKSPYSFSSIYPS